MNPRGLPTAAVFVEAVPVRDEEEATATGDVLFGGGILASLDGAASLGSRAFLSLRCKESLRSRIMGMARLEAVKV